MRRLFRLGLGYVAFGAGLALVRPAMATVTFSSGVLTYGAAGDFTSTVDPNNFLNDGPATPPAGGYLSSEYVGTSFGAYTPATFSALAGVQVMNFNNGQTQDSGTSLTSIVAMYDGVNSITFTPAVAYSYGSSTTRGNDAVDGATNYSAIGTVQSTYSLVGGAAGNAPNDWINFSVTISNPSAGALTAVAFMVVPHQDNSYWLKADGNTGLWITLSNGTVADVPFTGTIGGGSSTVPGGTGPSAGTPGSAFFSYVAPAGLYITAIEGNSDNSGSRYVTIDDLSMIVTAVPEPASLSFLGIGALALLRRRRSK